MKRLLQSFLVGIGYDYDEKGLKEYEKDIDSVKSGVAALTKVAVSAATALTGIVTVSTSATDQIGKFAAEINTSVEEVDALGFALERSGGTADGMQNSLRGIARRASEAARGMGEGVEAFGLLGVNTTTTNGALKSSSQLIREVSGAMQGLENGRQIELAEKLGIQDSLKLLQLGPGEIRKLTDEARALGVVTGEDAAIAAEFQDGLTDLWRIMKDISRTVSKELAPSMTVGVRMFTEWWKANRDIIDQNIAGFMDVVAASAGYLKWALLAVAAIAVLNGLAKVAKLMLLIRTRVLGATVAALILPAMLGAAALALIALVEDLHGYLNGKESLLGELVGDYPQYKDTLDSVAAVFLMITDTIWLALDGWKEIIRLSRLFSAENAKDVAKNIPGFLLDASNLKTIENDGILDNLGSKASGAVNNLIDKIDINIFGGGDPDQTAGAVDEKLRETFEVQQSTVDQ